MSEKCQKFPGSLADVPCKFGAPITQLQLAVHDFVIFQKKKKAVTSPDRNQLGPGESAQQTAYTAKHTQRTSITDAQGKEPAEPL